MVLLFVPGVFLERAPASLLDVLEGLNEGPAPLLSPPLPFLHIESVEVVSVRLPDIGRRATQPLALLWVPVVSGPRPLVE